MPKATTHLQNMQNLSSQTLSGIHDPKLQRTLKEDKQYLQTTELPIVTVSATYKEDLKGLHHLKERDTLPDIVLSRAHYSMTLGVAIQAWGTKIDPKKAWVVDPTNYVSAKDWKSIQITEFVGKTLARNPFLKKIKDIIDQFGRQKLPILASITPPLEYLTQDIPASQPILSLHIAAGNILAEQGKRVIQVITDPHVREDYLAQADLPTMTFCVFDEKTKTEFLEKASILGKEVDPTRIIVTGPPVDPRIIRARKNKKAWVPENKKPLRLCLTTGGLGTNKTEMETALKKLMPELRRNTPRFQLMIYAATHDDIRTMVKKIAHENHVAVHEIHPHDPAQFEISDSIKTEKITKKQQKSLTESDIILLYHPQLVDANELLIKYAFPWADGFITKPSGDMAYDAVAAGSFLLTLSEWGEWEHNIRQIFEQLTISRPVDTENIAQQLEALADFGDEDTSWVTMAMKNTQKIDRLFLEGAERIIAILKKQSL